VALLLLMASMAISASRDSGSGQASVTGSYFAVDGARLWFEEAGQPEAPAVVLLHDGLLHSVTWDAVWPLLAKRYHVVRYDRRGMGRSDAPTSPFMPTEDLAALMDHLHIVKATLVGSSSGAGLAIDFAIRHPSRVERLVLVGPVLHGMASSGHFTARGDRNNAPLAKGDVRAAAHNWADDRWQIAGANSTARRALFEALVGSPQNLRYDGRFERHFVAPAVARVGEIHVPTLILVGESDIPDVHAYAGAIEGGISGALREVVSGAGHLVQLEQAAPLTARIAKFIDEHPVVDVPAARLEGCAGTYDKALFGSDAQFQVRDGRLILQVQTERDVPLHPASDSTFYILIWGGYRFEFLRDANGRATSVDVSQDGKTIQAPRK
jgi:pimeloyl-ACP methyl ester carboxylesterase